jgi:hypothetical protein
MCTAASSPPQMQAAESVTTQIVAIAGWCREHDYWPSAAAADSAERLLGRLLFAIDEGQQSLDNRKLAYLREARRAGIDIGNGGGIDNRHPRKASLQQNR